MGFSLLSMVEFFADPKNGTMGNKKPPAMRVASQELYKNHLSDYNRGVQATIKERKGDSNGEESQWSRTYKMDVQISYRLHS